jgi:hypothetical protein
MPVENKGMPMMKKEVEPLWNLIQRRKYWWRSVQEVTLRHLPLAITLSVFGVLALEWQLDQMRHSAPDHLPWPSVVAWIMRLEIAERFLILLALIVIMALPIVLMTVGRYPRQIDVEHDQMLRRMHDMSDQVSDETEI